MKRVAVPFKYNCFVCHDNHFVFSDEQDLIFVEMKEGVLEVNSKVEAPHVFNIKKSYNHAIAISESEIHVVDIYSRSVLEIIQSEERILDADILSDGTNIQVLLSTTDQVLLLTIGGEEGGEEELDQVKNGNFGVVTFWKGRPFYWKNGIVYTRGKNSIQYAPLPPNSMVGFTHLLCISDEEGLQINGDRLDIKDVKKLKTFKNFLLIIHPEQVDVLDIVRRKLRYKKPLEVVDADIVEGGWVIYGGEAALYISNYSEYVNQAFPELRAKINTPKRVSSSPRSPDTARPSHPISQHGNVYVFNPLSQSQAEVKLLRVLQEWYPDKVILREYPLDCEELPHPKDFIIDNIVIEFDGPQHFRNNNYFKDIRFSCCSVREGYNIVRIYNIEEKGLVVLKQVLDGIDPSSDPKMFFIGERYDSHAQEAANCLGTEVVLYPI